MREPSTNQGKWLYPLAGMALGFLYVVLDEGVLDHLSPGTSWIVAVLHEFLDAILPILLGLSTGAGIYLLRRDRRLTRKLSVKNESLQSDLLAHTLISQMLHEIRNPVHTIMAALESGDALTADEQKKLITRNLGRFGELEKLYEGKETPFDRLNPREPLRVGEWVSNLIADKISSRLRELNIQLSRHVVPSEIRIHPLIFEQVLRTLFSNAIEAASEAPSGARLIGLEIRPAEGENETVLVRVSNSGALFPEEVLRSQGNSPAKSNKGHGLGLLLARKLLEQADGRMELGNREGKAEVLLRIPGKPA